jgi:hypothetical protein
MTALEIAQLLPPEFNRWKQRAKLGGAFRPNG